MVAPARGATMLKKQIIPIVRAFQSALPRGERQQIGGSPDEDRNISIHAPTRGATSWRRSPQSNIRYFNPRSHEGSDGKLFAAHAVLTYFNPRSHEGSDNWLARHLRYPGNFNPRSHEGSDVQRGKIFYSLRRFQSTLPRGERPQYRTIIHSIVYFNPRSHEGSDGNMLLQLLSTVISIHAPTRGATRQVRNRY